MEELAHYIALAEDALRGVPEFVYPLVSVLLAIVLAVLLHGLVFRALSRITEANTGLSGTLVRRTKSPSRLGFVLLGLIIVLPRVALPDRWQDGLQQVALILLLVLMGWTVLLLTNLYSERSLRHYRLDTEDNLAARKYVTQVRVLRRTVAIIVVIMTVAAVLLTFESVRSYGISLFASAGVAGLVLGLAARPVLTNLIAGVQIALTQPIRLEDVVIVEGEWGWVEDIFATYVVIRLWDWRRMVVPLSYFIEKPFQNWTRETASIIGSVYWYLDYTVPVSEMRAKLEEFVKASPRWDGKVVNLQVTDADKDTIFIRGLMSARTSPLAWDLRCEIREKMIGWLQDAYPEALPRLRMEPVDAAGESRLRRQRAEEGLG